VEAADVNPQDFIAPLVAALFEGDLIGVIFRAALPAGSSFDVPIERQAYAYGPLTATVCASGCTVRITVRSVTTTATSTTQLPIRASVVLEVSVATLGSIPVRTSLGDLDIGVDTARGRNHLRFRLPVVVGSATTPVGYFRLRDVPPQLAALGVAVDLGEVVAERGFDIESEDISVTGASVGGRIATSVIDRYKLEILSWLRAEVRYQINKALCERLGAVCPARVRPRMPELRVPAAVPWVASLSATALILWLASRKQASAGLGACPSCGGASHPATGSVTPSGKVVCGPCVRRFWSWASEHGKKSYRAGPKGKKAKYLPFPTGVTRK
jgi:hypothetical protein